MMLREYSKKEFRNISDESLVDDTNKEEVEKITTENKRLLDNIKESLSKDVTDVVISTKLVDAPVCISTKDGLSLNMENVLNEEPNREEEVKSTKVLEINPNHELFIALSKLQDNDEEVKKYASILYDEALMLEGYEIKNKPEFVKKLNELLVKSLNK